MLKSEAKRLSDCEIPFKRKLAQMSLFKIEELMETKHMLGFRQTVFFLVIFFISAVVATELVFYPPPLKFLNELHGLNSGFIEAGAEICTDIDCAGNAGGGSAV